MVLSFSIHAAAQTADPQLAMPAQPPAQQTKPVSAEPQLPTKLPPKLNPPVIGGTSGGAVQNEEVPLPAEPVVIAPVNIEPVVVVPQNTVQDISSPAIVEPVIPVQAPVSIQAAPIEPAETSVTVGVSTEVKTPPPEGTVATRLKAKPTVSRGPRFAFSIHYSSLGRFIIPDGTRIEGTTKTKVKGDFDSRTAMGAGLSIWSAHRDSWGFMAGISLEGARELETVNWTSPASGGSVFSGGRNSSIILGGIEGNAIYRAGDIYFLSGLNASVPAYQKAVGETGETKLHGGLGIQIGVGGFANESVSFEALYKIISIGINHKDSAGEFDSGPVLSDGLQLQTKFTF